LKNSLKVERAKKNITQGELAEHIGVSRQTINAIETGKFVPSTILAIKLSKYFKVRVEDIFILETNDL